MMWTYPLTEQVSRDLVRTSLGLTAHAYTARDLGGAMLYAKDANFDACASPSVLAIGAFDGVHTGHRSLITAAIEDARARGATTTVVTFDPDPAEVLAPDAIGLRLLSVQDRIAQLFACGVDAVLTLPFNEELRCTDYEAFLLDLVPRFVKYCAVHVGSDFHMGAGRGGDVSLLQDLGRAHGFDVFGEDLLDADGAIVSATRIRASLREGNLSLANSLLGRAHFIRGSVAHGRGEGTGFGFPTANVVCSLLDCSPKEGVYACFVEVDGTAWPAATNVGAPPTFSEARPAFLEANLLGFSGDIYGADVAVVFVERLRDSVHFDSFDELSRAVFENIDWTRENIGDSGVGVSYEL